MRVVNNDAELEAAIMKDISAAMDLAEKKALATMHKAISDFYAGGYPSVYQRTYQLSNTPEITDRKRTKFTASFLAQLNDHGSYTTGSRPSMAQVLQLTNEGSAPGLRPAVGAPSYWDWAEVQIGQDFDSAMKQYFD